MPDDVKQPLDWRTVLRHLLPVIVALLAGLAGGTGGAMLCAPEPGKPCECRPRVPVAAECCPAGDR